MIQQEIIELTDRLQQERVFVTAEVKAIARLNEDVSRTAGEAFKAAWVAQQQRRNLAALALNETKAVSCCRKAALLEVASFVDGYRHLNQHEPKYGQWLAGLRSKPALLAAQLLHIERLSSAAAAGAVSDAVSGTPSDVVSVLISTVYGCCVLRSDEAIAAELVLVLARSLYCGNSSILRRSSSMFHTMLAQFIECLPSARLFLTSALHPAVMLLLMKDDYQYDLDSQKTYHLFSMGRRLHAKDVMVRVSALHPAGDLEVTEAAARHRAVVAQQMVEVLQCLMTSIRQSVRYFPVSLLWIVNQLFRSLIANGSTDATAKTACADVVFESFVCPALLNADAHGLTTDAPISVVARHNLTEVARVLRILSRCKWMGSSQSQLNSPGAATGNDVMSHIDKDGLSDIIEVLVSQEPTDKPAVLKDVNGIVRSAVLVTLNDLRRLVAFQRNVSLSLPEDDPVRVCTEQLLHDLPPLPPSASVVAASPATVGLPLGASPPGTPPVSRTKSAKKLSLLGASGLPPSPLTSSAPAPALPPLPEAFVDSHPDEVLVIALHNSSSDEVGLMPEHKVMQAMEEQEAAVATVLHRTAGSSEGAIKRTRFSLTASAISPTPQPGVSVGDVAELADAISEAASVHSVGSTTLDIEDMGDGDDDDMSDMVSANVSGRGSPNVSGRDTPQSGATGGGGGGHGDTGDKRDGDDRPPPVANVPVTIKKAEEDLPDRFGMFDIRSQIRAGAGGDLEVRSTVSDSWSTDVLGGSDMGGGGATGPYDEDEEDARRLERRLLEVADEPSLLLQLPQATAPPQQQQRPLSAGLLLLGSANISETASESAWSTDVLAASDTSERPSERLRELENIDEQLRSMGFMETSNDGESRLNLDDIESDASDTSDVASIDAPSSEHSSSGGGRDLLTAVGAGAPHPNAIVDRLLGVAPTRRPHEADSVPVGERDAGVFGVGGSFFGTVKRQGYSTSTASSMMPAAQASATVPVALPDSGRVSALKSSAEEGSDLMDLHTATSHGSCKQILHQNLAADDLMDMFDPLACGDSVTGMSASLQLPLSSRAAAFNPSAAALNPSAAVLNPSVLALNSSAAALNMSAVTRSPNPAQWPGTAAGNAEGGRSGSVVRRRPDNSSRPLSRPANFSSIAQGNDIFPIDSFNARPPTWPLGPASLVSAAQPGHGSESNFWAQVPNGDTRQGSSFSHTSAWDPFGLELSTSPQNISLPTDGSTTRFNDEGQVTGVVALAGSLESSGEVGPKGNEHRASLDMAQSVSPLPRNEDLLAELGLASLKTPDDKMQTERKKKTLFHSLKMSIKGKRKEGKESHGSHASSRGGGIHNSLYDESANGAAGSSKPLPMESGGQYAAEATAGSAPSAGSSISRLTDDGVEDILAKYRSIRRSSVNLDRQLSGAPDSGDGPMSVTAGGAGAAAAQGSNAFADAKKKLRLVLSSSDPEVLRSVVSAPIHWSPHLFQGSGAHGVDEDNDIVRLLQVLLSQAISLQNKPVIAQLHETIRCLRQFTHKSACRKLLRAMKEDYRSRVHYISYLTRSRQGLMVSLAHLQRTRDSQTRDKDISHLCFISECVRIFLNKKEQTVVQLRDDFGQLSAADEKCDMVERGLDALFQDMAGDNMWQAASEQQLDAAQLAIERHVMAAIYRDAMFPNSDADLERDRIFHESVQKLGRGLTPDHSELKIPSRYHMEFPWKSAQEEIIMLNAYKTPRDKLHCVVRCSKVVMNLLSMAGEERSSVPAADDFLPVFICVVALANPEYLLSTVQYVDAFYGRRMDGEEAYWWMQLKSAVAFITMWMQKPWDAAVLMQRAASGNGSTNDRSNRLE